MEYIYYFGVYTFKVHYKSTFNTIKHTSFSQGHVLLMFFMEEQTAHPLKHCTVNGVAE